MKSKKTSRKHSKKYKKPKGMSCKDFLKMKIAYNIREFKNGRPLSNGRKISSIKQAIAIAYSEVKSAGCKV